MQIGVIKENMVALIKLAGGDTFIFGIYGYTFIVVEIRAYNRNDDPVDKVGRII